MLVKALAISLESVLVPRPVSSEMVLKVKMSQIERDYIGSIDSVLDRVNDSAALHPQRSEPFWSFFADRLMTKQRGTKLVQWKYVKASGNLA